MNATATIRLEGTPEEISEMTHRIDSLKPAGKCYCEIYWDKNIPYPEGKTVPL